MIVDANISLERWPFRRTPCDELPRMVEKLQRHGVGQAWAGSLDGLFHRDIGGVNLRLAEACRGTRDPVLIPFGSVNPMLPDWREDIRRCHEQFRMPGIRLHPAFHGYRLDHPSFAALLDSAAARSLIVQIVVRMDDVRMQHPLIDVPDVDVSPLAELSRARPGLRLALLNAAGKTPEKTLRALASSGAIHFDLATQDGVEGIAKLAAAVTPQRVLFGSHLPLFSLESAVLKMKEAGLDPDVRALIEHQNATRLLAPSV